MGEEEEEEGKNKDKNKDKEIKDIVWPLYSQQCTDDAGPPFGDDEPGKFYHDGSKAEPVLQPGGKCAAPLVNACKARPTKKVAYIEGPIDCGGNGWYCRIMPDPNWPGKNLIADLNFGHCNSTESFDDAGYDKDGHCHGSSDDSTYYWWMRDHWHRDYNGRLRCCCGWYEGGETPLYSSRIANRCDYRRLVTKDENIDNCRDANEDHGLGFDDIGCDPKYESQIGKPIPETDAQCWELSRFGVSEGGDNDENEDGDKDEEEDEEKSGDEKEDEEEEDEEKSGDEEDCEEGKKTKFFEKKKKDKVLLKTCRWLQKQKNKKKVMKICKMKSSQSEKFDVARVECPVTCGAC